MCTVSLSQNKANVEIEEDENPLDEHRTASNETIMASKILLQVDDDSITVAPGEGKKPISIFEDTNCEEMAFPH